MNVQEPTPFFGVRVARRLLPHRRPVTARQVAAAIADHLMAGGHLDAGLTRGVGDRLGVRRRRAARLLAQLRAGQLDGQQAVAR